MHWYFRPFGSYARFLLQKHVVHKVSHLNLPSRKNNSCILRMHFVVILKKLILPSYQHYLNPFVIKLRRKALTLFQNRAFWTSTQPFATYFFQALCNVCQVAIPEFFIQTQGYDYRQLVHLLNWWACMQIYFYTYPVQRSKRLYQQANISR